MYKYAMAISIGMLVIFELDASDIRNKYGALLLFITFLFQTETGYDFNESTI